MTKQHSIMLGIPKGSLEEATLHLLDQVGLQFTGSSRSLWLGSNDPEIVPVLLKPQEIPQYVESGRLDAGLAGHDWIEENGVERRVIELADLQYAKQTARPVRWVLAVPDQSPVTSVDDLRAECDRRGEEGEPRFRIATELTHISRRWLAKNGIDAWPDFSWGATEAKAGYFTEAIIEATETGSSLRANGLRIVAEVFRSTTRFISNREIYRGDKWKRRKLEGIAHLLVGALRADDMVQLNIVADHQFSLDGLLPDSAQVTTLSASSNGDAVQAVAIVAKGDVPRTLPAVIAGGASRAWVSPVSLFYQRDETTSRDDADANNNNVHVEYLSVKADIGRSLTADVRRGFALSPKQLPPKYFYDVEGSGIFDKITELPEYYVARAEQEALTHAVRHIVATQPWTRLVELGSGSSQKTRVILEEMLQSGPTTYSPLDISESALTPAGTSLAGDYPDLTVQAFVGDFLTQDLDVVLGLPSPKLVVFLGSTLGNLTPDERQQLYARYAAHASLHDAMLLGIDLVKDASAIEEAYNDAAGVTEEFNRNVLRVLRRELGATIEPEDFRHHAPYLTDQQCVEMRLYAQRDVEVSFADDVDLSSYRIQQDEYILTELAQKFTRDDLKTELSTSGLIIKNWWTDNLQRVALALVCRHPAS